MTNIWISAAQAHVPGPQKKSMTEANQVQVTTVSITSFNYVQNVDLGSMTTEPNQIQVSSISVPSFDYQPHLAAANPGAEPNQIQATVSIISFNYA